MKRRRKPTVGWRQWQRTHQIDLHMIGIYSNKPTEIIRYIYLYSSLTWIMQFYDGVTNAVFNFRRRLINAILSPYLPTQLQ